MILPLLHVAALTFAGSVTQFVDPMIGTATTGHTFPGATWPHGMVQLSPDTGFEGWEHCSGYHHDDKAIYGFSHMHLSGTGATDLGDILVAPNVGDVKFEPGDPSKPGSGYLSRFSHKNEIAKAGYYEVKLDDPQVRAQLTVTPRVGIHRYTFPKTGQANLTFEITNQIGGQERSFSAAKWISPTELEGTIFTNGWARDQHCYFVARFSRPATNYGVAIDNKLAPGKKEASGKLPLLDAFATFDTSKDQVVMVKVGISNVGTDGARKNLDAEATSWDFNGYVKQASQAWNNQLAPLQIAGASKAQKRTFYTALYHADIHPSLYQDVDGRYLGMDRKIHQSPEGTQYYHIYSLWDTYRAAHPLYQLLEPSKNAQFINGMLERYKIRGELPVWELCSSENYCMIGDPGVPAVANAVINGAAIDKKLALEAVQASLAHNGRGQTQFLQYGFDPSDKEPYESVSKTLEFAYANGAGAEMAKFLGANDVAAKLWDRSQAYKKVFNPAVGLMCPKTSDGNWVADYNPARLDYDPRYVTEGNSWQYNWLVMHDLAGLESIYGGRQKALKKLEETFDPKNEPIGGQADVTGLIGQYAHGNEPSHHTAYLFTAFGRPDLTDKYVQQIRDGYYHDGADGLCGNDDCGQTSAWYVFSAMGFYPLDPASGEYVLGIPAFPSMTVRLEDGKTIRVVAKNLDLAKGKVREVRWNGKLLKDWKIKHKDLIQGGTLEFFG